MYKVTLKALIIFFSHFGNALASKSAYFLGYLHGEFEIEFEIENEKKDDVASRTI